MLERLGKFGKVYDYPEGTIPDPERDDRYCVPWGDSEYYRVKDGAAYYRVLPPDPTVSMATYYPRDREPDFSEGGHDFFRITSAGDARLWYAWMFADEASAAELVYHDGLLYTRGDAPAPTVDDARLTWIKPDGTLIYIDCTEDAAAPDLVADLNGDGKADVIYHGEAYAEGAGATRGPYRKAAYSRADGYRIVRLDALEGAVTADFNRDGRRDIFMFHSEGWAQPYRPLVWLQLADGTFAAQPLDVVTDPGEIAAAQFSDGGNGSFTNNSVNLSGFSGPGKGSSYDEAPRMEAVDVNMDGYPDLIDPDGNSFLSLPDGRYYSAGIAGSVTAADINGDGVKDMVVFDGGTLSDNAITWETPGLKTVAVTVNSLRSEHKILIKAKPDLDFALPDKAIGGSVLTVALPEAAASAYGSARMTVDGGSAMIDAAAGTAVITLPRVDGKAEVRLACEDDVFGMVEVVKTIDVVGSAFRPEIAMVTVSDGRNVVSWDAAMPLPADGVLDGTVNVYRETNMADEYEKVAVVSLADGRYVDAESRPDVKTTRYMLTMNTAVGGETQPGRVHGNIHVMINRGLGNDINLHWLPYTGADVAQYTILAGTSADDLAVIDVISGNSQSFTHKRDGDTPMLYSLAYTLKQDAPAASARSRNSSAEGRSNVISSAEAYGVTMVEAIEITSVEGTMAVDATRPSIRLKAVVAPAVATIANVEWSIIDGGNLAGISPEGVLSVKPNAAGGNVRVQARAVNGSGVTQEADVTVGSYTHIAGAAAADGQVIIGVRGRTVMIDGMADNTDVLITDVAGCAEYRSTTGGSLRISPLPAGVHIVRAGGKTAKVIVR